MKSGDRKEIRALIKGRVLFNAPMNQFTSMRVGGAADILLFPKNVRDLSTIMQYARKRSIPTLVIGNGTNLIVRDKGVRGWVISLAQGLKRVELKGEVIEAGAGLSLERLVRWASGKAITGFESFVGIPGTVGGGLAMNAGAWGMELKDRLLSLMFMREDGEVMEVPASNLRFSYRGLELPPFWIIVQGRFRAERGKKEEIAERMKRYREMRRRQQPLDFPSAGSVFKNPAEGAAGKLIEEVGLKGHRIGQAMVSDRHANFIINLGNATASEVIRLIEGVERRVHEAKGISLEREVKVVGD